MTNQTNHQTDSIADQIKALKRPGGWATKYLIEAELDDLVALVEAREREALKIVLDKLIDQEIELYKIYSDNTDICTGIKIMADEVRAFYDLTQTPNNNKEIN